MLTATRPHGYEGPASTLVAALCRSVRRAPDETAVVEGDVRLTYSELLNAASNFASSLHRRGVRRGDVVMVQLPNWWEHLVTIWGTWIAGCAVLPVVPLYRERELTFIIGQSRPAAVVVPREYRGCRHARMIGEIVQSDPGTLLVEVRGAGEDVTVGATSFQEMIKKDWRETGFATVSAGADEVAAVLYTSGTTSSPKGVLHTHRTLLAETATIRRHCELTSTDSVFMPSPLSHITGLAYGVILPADIGCATVLMERWAPESAVNLIERERCTFTVSATPFLRGLNEVYSKRSVTRSSLTRFVCGGADIPPELVRAAHGTMGTDVLRTYGSTELPTVVMADPRISLVDRSRGDGRPIGHNEVRVDSSGELLVRGPELFVGYLDARLNEEAFTEDGYFRTGDLAEVDSNGEIRVTGRIKDIINRGGEKYSASEIEFALQEHPRIEDVAIVAYPDEELGERACAFVVAREDPPSVAEIRRFLVGRGFAVQKAPERMIAIDVLPRNASGKIQKFVLRDRIGRECSSGEGTGEESL
ncbi:AMP-binding protein [Rhodococcus sp. ABRD24]|uniref:AMP-binding protein n=1 Tax=Rhodococcus sp. ABRD24 TaxID=2507582 RepID=UPI0013F17778|nr:AMP-binding protein [Rhodococcus sp. ABRD24]